MLIECRMEEFIDYIADDPVRPNLFEDNVTRFQGNFRVFADVEKDLEKQGVKLTVNAIVCVVICPFLPQSEKQLRSYAVGDLDNLVEEIQDILDEEDMNAGQVLCLYSLWSYSKGAGRKLVNELLEAVPVMYPNVNSVVTMSPPTKMAMQFHTGNGAVLISPNLETVNYEYEIPNYGIAIH